MVYRLALVLYVAGVRDAKGEGALVKRCTRRGTRQLNAIYAMR